MQTALKRDVRWKSVTGLVLCVILVSAWAPLASADEDTAAVAVASEIVWLHSYYDAVTVASEGNKPVIAEFYTDWCTWCDRLEDSTFTHPLVQAMADSFVFVRINAELDTALTARFGISGYPTVLLLEQSGNETDRILGYKTPEEFVTTIDAYIKGEGTLWALEKQNRERPSDPETLFELAQKHMGRGDFASARPHFERVVSMGKDNSSGTADNAQFALGLMFRKDRQWFKAIEAFSTLIELFPESELREDAELYIPWLNARAGDSQEAIDQYNNFLEHFSKSSETDWVREQIQQIDDQRTPPEDETEGGEEDDSSS